MSENDTALSTNISGGSMKRNNPTAYEKHQGATHAAHERLSAAIDEREHKAKGLEAKAHKLMLIPRYLSGEMKNSNLERYNKITKEVSRLFNSARPVDDPSPVSEPWSASLISNGTGGVKKIKPKIEPLATSDRSRTLLIRIPNN